MTENTFIIPTIPGAKIMVRCVCTRTKKRPPVCEIAARAGTIFEYEYRKMRSYGVCVSVCIK